MRQLKKLLLSGFFIFPLLIIGQITYDPGYIVNNDGTRVSCFIYNIDWVNTPETFKYRITENGEEKEATVDNVQEVGILNGKKFVRKTIEIDQSPSRLKELNFERNAIFETETVFVGVLIEGDGSLYKFIEDGTLHFYLSTPERPELTPLVYKRYYSKPSVVGENRYYRQQLFNLLKCPKFKESTFNKVNYSERDLMEIVLNYNTCESESSTDYVEKKKKTDRINIIPKIGYRIHNLKMNPSIGGGQAIDFNLDAQFVGALEIEYLFNFHRNKWSVFTQFTHASFEKEQVDVANPFRDYKIVFKTVELSVGARHSMYLNEEMRVMLSAGFVLPISNTAEFYNELKLYKEDKALPAQFASAGFSYKNFFADVSYHFRPQLFDTYNTGDYSVMLFTLGYSLL